MVLCYIAGSGLWMPDAAPLAALRQSVDRSPHRIKRILMNPIIRRDILGGVKKDERKATHAFVSQNTENALKTKPKVSSEHTTVFVTSPGRICCCTFPLSVQFHLFELQLAPTGAAGSAPATFATV